MRSDKKFIILFIFTFFCFYLYSKFFIFNPEYKQDKDEESARIYLDIATNPTIFEGWNLAGTPKNIKKFVGWARDEKLYERLKNNDYNIEVIKWRKTSEPEIEPILKYHKENPDKKFIIYANWRHDWILLAELIKKIKKENIKEIHLYEDSFYSASFDKGSYELYKNFRRKQMAKHNLIFHFKNADKINSPLFFLDADTLYIKRQISKFPIAETRFEDIKTEGEKDPDRLKRYFYFLGFDYEKYKKEIEHPYCIYLFSVLNNEVFLRNQLEFLDRLQAEHSKKGLKWYYKAHPSTIQQYDIKKIMNLRYKDVKPIDRHLPIEIFYITDLAPEYIAGYSSSSFFNISSKTEIIAFIKRPKDPYLRFLFKKRLLKLNRIFEL